VIFVKFVTVVLLVCSVAKSPLYLVWIMLKYTWEVKLAD